MICSMDKILLIGANGNIGSFLVKAFDEKYDLTITSSSKRIDLKKHEILDLTDTQSIESFSSKYDRFDFLIFPVGLAHKKGKSKDYNDFRLLNFLSLKNLLTALKKQNKIPRSIIFISTISVYGEKINKQVYFEDSNLSPQSPYAITKVEAENFLKKFYPENLYILRLAPVYSSEFKINLIRRAKAFFWYFRVGDGNKKLSLCNMNNIALTIKNIIEKKIPSDTYNLSDNREYVYNDLLKYFNTKYILSIPYFFIKVVYFYGRLVSNDFCIENSIKLLTNNIYPSNKIRKYVILPYNLFDE